MQDEEIKTKYQNLLKLVGEKTNQKGKSLRYYYTYFNQIQKEKEAFILDILLSFLFINNAIYIKNKKYLIFYSKFLDTSKRILEEDYKEEEPKIIINSAELKTLGKDKELILQYIKLSSLYEKESLKLFFYFLNQNFTLLNLRFLNFNKKEDLTNINKLKKVYHEMKSYKVNKKEEKNFVIKITTEDRNENVEKINKEQNNNINKKIRGNNQKINYTKNNNEFNKSKNIISPKYNISTLSRDNGKLYINKINNNITNNKKGEIIVIIFIMIIIIFKNYYFSFFIICDIIINFVNI